MTLPAQREDAMSDLDFIVADGSPTVLLAHGVTSMPAALEWLRDRRTGIRAALDRFGSLMVRGLPVADAAGFAAARDVLIDQRVPYRENSTPRSDYGNDVWSSTDMPATHRIRLHNENSYVLQFPGVLLFGCVVAPQEDGATTVGDSREVLHRIDPAVVGRFRDRGWLLLRNYQAHMSIPWQTAFGTDRRDEAEDYFRRNLIAHRWLDDDQLRTSQRRSAILRHPRTGEESWFNHAAFWSRHSLAPDLRDVLVASYGEAGLPYDCAFGDGSKITAEEIAHIAEAYDGATCRESYRVGDLLLVDNILSSHGREPYRGDRRVLVALGEPRDVADCAPTVAPAPGPLPS